MKYGVSKEMMIGDKVMHGHLLPINYEIGALVKELHEASRRKEEIARGLVAGDRWRSNAWLQARRRLEELHERIDGLKQQARGLFAAARGWRRTSHTFHVDGIVRGLRHSPIYTTWNNSRDLRDISALGHPHFDHAEYYKTPGRQGICVGIVSHAYLGDRTDHSGPRGALDYAQRAGLTCEVFTPAYSWYYPGATTLLVFSRAAQAALSNEARAAPPPGADGPYAERRMPRWASG